MPEETSTINSAATEQASRGIGSNQGKTCVRSHQVSINYKQGGTVESEGTSTVWVFRKGISASKNKPEARGVLEEDLFETDKCKGPAMLASESKHRSPDSIWCPGSGML